MQRRGTDNDTRTQTQIHIQIQMQLQTDTIRDVGQRLGTDSHKYRIARWARSSSGLGPQKLALALAPTQLKWLIFQSLNFGRAADQFGGAIRAYKNVLCIWPKTTICSQGSQLIIIESLAA